MKSFAIFFLLTFSLSTLAAPMKGQSKEGSKIIEIELSYDVTGNLSKNYLKLGALKYIFNDISHDQLQGSRIVTENGQETVNESVLISLEKSNFASLIRAFGVKLRCNAGDNVLILVADNQTDKIKGICANLK